MSFTKKTKILFSFVFLFLITHTSVWAQTSRPKLVVGIVVDQMRQEYLYRFQDQFGENGFNRLAQDGFSLTHAHYNYIPTQTGPGHASLYTGTTPSVHGIVANAWFDSEKNQDVPCVADLSYQSVGSDEPGASPQHLLTTTLTDELKISTQNQSKVYSLSLKDRGAILPAGHYPDGVFWYSSKTGRFVSSTYYMPALPDWIKKFNKKNIDLYSTWIWEPLLELSQYKVSTPDNSRYETIYPGKKKPVFPYSVDAINKATKSYAGIQLTPFGNDMLTQLAKETIEHENLGQDAVTDFLCISYSSTDIAGHSLGPQAVEIEDMYMRLDKNLADLLDYLDKKLGPNEYLIFLSSDHGADEARSFLSDRNITSGYWDVEQKEDELKEALRDVYPDRTIIQRLTQDQVYLSPNAFAHIPKLKSPYIESFIVEEFVISFLQRHEAVARVYPSSVLRQIPHDENSLRGHVIRGYYPGRSGNIVYTLKPHWNSYPTDTGTTHGSAYTYDTHVPVIFYGANIPKGRSSIYHPITDIAPTLSLLLQIKYPSGCTGNPITELLDKL